MNPGKPPTPEGTPFGVTLFVRSAPRLFDLSRRVSKAARGIGRACITRSGEVRGTRSGNRAPVLKPNQP